VRTIRYRGTDIGFKVSYYTPNPKREAVVILDLSDDTVYGILTVNIPFIPLDDGDCILDNDYYGTLITELIENGYFIFKKDILFNYGSYVVGHFTQKFYNELAVKDDED
jgi:hypothetical protein